MPKSLGIKRKGLINCCDGAQASQTGYGDHVVAKYWKVSFEKVHWTRSLFRKFLDVKVPMALVYGQNDQIIPANQVMNDPLPAVLH